MTIQRIGIFWEQESWGGVDTHTLNLLIGLQQYEDKFFLFVNSNNQGFKRIEQEIQKINNVSVKVYKDAFPKINDNKFSRKVNALFRPLIFFKSILILKNMIKKYNLDGFITQNGGYPASWGCIAANFSARRCGIKKNVMIIHHAADPIRNYQAWFEKIVDIRLSKFLTKIIAVSEATKDSILNNRPLLNLKQEIKVVYNSISLSNSGNNYKDLRALFQIPKKLKLIGIVGRIEDYKGHEDLILGYSMLSKKIQSKIKLIFIGSGNQDELLRLKSLESELGLINSVLYTGFLDFDSKEIIKQLDLLCVMTRDFEGFGLTIGEAMYCETPVLTTNVGAITEYASDKNATLIPPNSPEIVSTKLLDFIENYDVYIKKTKTAKKLALNFSTDKMAEKIRNILLS